MYVCMHMYIYIYIERERETCMCIYIYIHIYNTIVYNVLRPISRLTIVDLKGLDSSIILILRGGILMSVGHFPESLSQAILVGIILVGKSGVHHGIMY